MAFDITPAGAAHLWAREHASYSVAFRGNPVGSYVVDLTPDPAKEQLKLATAYEDANLRTRGELIVERESLLPVSVWKEIQSPQGAFHLSGSYAEKVLELKIQTPGGPQQVRLDLAQEVLDNESVLMVIRALPLADGYRGSLEVANIESGRTYFSWIERTEKQSVTGPDGAVACHRVRLTFDYAESHEMWYSLEPPHTLLRYDNRSVVFSLTEQSREPI